MRSRSRSPARRHSPGQRSRSSYGNGESSGMTGDRCQHCMQTVRRHQPGPEGALPDKDILKNMIVNPHGVRPQAGQTISVEDVKIPRRCGEGMRPLFGFMSARRVVQIVRPDEGNNSARSRSSSNQRDGSRRFDRHDSRGDGSRRHPDSYRPDREDERRREERRREKEKEEERRNREQAQRDRERNKKKEEESKPVKTEAAEGPDENQDENGGPSNGGHGSRPPQWMPPVRPPMYFPPPHPYPPMGPPPMWGPYPRPFLPRPNIRRPPRY